MLERITGPGEGGIERVRIADASFPAPFPRSLEYNAPAHGTWNIVHIGMAVPQSHSIYVCADNCLRGVVMTAAEMGCSDRFSSVMISERDPGIDNLETITIEGVSDVIEHLGNNPPVVFVFLVCLHIFAGSDEDYIFRELGRRFPQIRFVKGYMDCIRQKEGPTPDMKLRMAEYTPVEPLETVPGRVNVLGCDIPFPQDCELMELLGSHGYDVRQLKDLSTYQEFLSLGDAAVNICTYPNAREAVRALSDRMGCAYAYLSAGVSFDEIRDQIMDLAGVCGFEAPGEDWFSQRIFKCRKALGELSHALEGWQVCIDYTAHSRPLGIARLLVSHGINVRCVFLNQILDDDREAYMWLRDNCPDLELISTILPGMVQYGRGRSIPGIQEKTIAVGQTAAWYCQSGHFVNIIEGGGLWGYQGIMSLCALIKEASERTLDYRRIIPGKGMGWPCLCPELTVGGSGHGS